MPDRRSAPQARPAPAAATVLAVVALAAPFAGCGGPPAPDPTPAAPLVLRAPHWDQVCRVAPEGTPLRSVDEVLDHADLPGSVLTLYREADAVSEAASDAWPGAASEDPSEVASRSAPGELRARVADALPSSPPPGMDPARLPPATLDPLPYHLDVGFRFDRGGRVGAIGVLESSFTPATAARLAARVGAALRPPTSLLEPVRGRIRVEADAKGRLRRVRLLDPVLCIPHLPHPGAVPLRALGEGVEVLAAGPRSCEGECLRLLVHVDSDGRVARIERRSGDAALLERVRPRLEKLVFDPALRNGEPVEGEIPLRLRRVRPRPAQPPSAASGSRADARPASSHP